MKIYNYLSRKVEVFRPSGKTVSLYTCGPTLYDNVHIGNWRTFIFEDVLKRVLLINGHKVKHVMNLTDIDDKIIKKVNDQHVSIAKLTSKFSKSFFSDLSKLNIEKADVYPRATQSIASMIRIIEELLKRGYAYKGEDGIYFSVEKFPSYGKLSGLERQNLKKGARVNDDEYDKENWSDFALWKFKKINEPRWESPFGEGRPGWHIECSAMAISELGESIDIHSGGVDLLFPHHENEIAQSEAVTGKKFVNYWLEGEHLLVEGEKMAKRLKNIFTLSDIAKKGFDPIALRYLFLTAHYRSKLNFTWESLEASQNALNNLRKQISAWDSPRIGCAEYEDDFKQKVSDELDMPRAISVMWQMIKSEYPTSAKHQSLLAMDKVLGLGLDSVKRAELPKGARELIEKREKFRKEGKFDAADKLRAELIELGVEVEDTNEGSKWKIVND